MYLRTAEFTRLDHLIDRAVRSEARPVTAGDFATVTEPTLRRRRHHRHRRLRGVVRRAGIDAVRAHWPSTDDGFAALTRLTRIRATGA
jgi:hypothetical protein